MEPLERQALNSANRDALIGMWVFGFLIGLFIGAAVFSGS